MPDNLSFVTTDIRRWPFLLFRILAQQFLVSCRVHVTMYTSSMACAIQKSVSTAPGQLQSLQSDNADLVETNNCTFLYLVQLIKSILALCLQQNNKHKLLTELKSLNSQVAPNDLDNNTKNILHTLT